MWGLKRDMTATEMVFVDPKTGKITDTITDTHLRSLQVDADIVSYVENVLSQHPGTACSLDDVGRKPCIYHSKSPYEKTI